MSDFEPLLTTEEAAQHLRLHPKTLQRFARQGLVPCVRLGKYWLFRLSALDVWIQGQQNQSSQPLLAQSRRTMKRTRNAYQAGSLRKVQRKSGAAVWEYRYRDHSVPGSPMRQLTLRTLDFPTKVKALVHLQEQVLRMNGAGAFRFQQKPTMGLVIERFIKEERIEEIIKQKPGEVTIHGFAFSTAVSYRSYLTKHLKPKWGTVALESIKPLAVTEWIKALPLAPKSKGHVRGLLHMLFEKAMLWELMGAQRNPVELVRVKGTSRRTRQITVLEPAQIQTLLELIQEPYRTMVVIAVCLGLRVSEILPLRWEHFNFSDGVLLVQHGAVNGRVGDVKTEASNDYVPLDPAFASLLLELKGGKTSGLLFPSHRTGGCYFASEIQKDVLKPAGKKIGIASLGWHALRHTYRTLLDETGAPIGVQQKLMRHANISTTANVYGRSSMKAKAEANSKVVQMFFAKEKPSDFAESRAV